MGTRDPRNGIGASRAVLVSAAALILLLILCASAGASADTDLPLPASDYTVRHVCATPSPGDAGCLALELVSHSSEASLGARPLAISRTGPLAAPSPRRGEVGLRPEDLHKAYDLPEAASSTQTIALVDAYNDPTAEADLETYDQEFELPPCGSGCFRKVNQRGEEAKASLPFPKTTRELQEAGSSKEAEEARSWSIEISLDIESARATCENCKILLVEADSVSFEDLEGAEETAVKDGANEISNSWGASEAEDTVASAKPFDHPHTVITAAAGDDGYLDWDDERTEERGHPFFPASSSYVVAVGGTRLLLNEASERRSETVWNDGGEDEGALDGYGASGGGCSEIFGAASWQQSDSFSVGCAGKRAVADVAADGDPYTGIAVRDSVPGSGCETPYREEVAKKTVPESLPDWCTIGGTSLASPLIASVFALAGGSNDVEYPARTLYENETNLPSSLYDVTEGSNGECLRPFDEETALTGCTVEEEARASCAAKAICLAGKGYDGPTGVGTPAGIAAFQPPVSETGKESSKGGGKEQINTENKKEVGSGGTEGEGPAGTSAGTPASGSSETGAGVSAGVSTGVSPGTPTTPPSESSDQPTIKLSALALTSTALLALDRPRSRISSLDFAFTLNAAARVRATLAKLVRVHGHDRWVLLPGAATFSAAEGRNLRRLASPDALTAGRYRLTVAPGGGVAQTLTLHVG